jgi:predicted ferric reductase
VLAANTPARRLALVLAVVALALAVAAGIRIDRWDRMEQVYWFEGRAYYWHYYAGRAASVLIVLAAFLWFAGPPLRKLISWIARGRVD